MTICADPKDPGIGIRIMERIIRHKILQSLVILIFSIFLQMEDARGQENLIKGVSQKVLVTLFAHKTNTLSAEVSGTIIKAPYEMGQRFKIDESLVELNPKLFSAEKRKASALLKYAIAAFETNYSLNVQKSIASIEFAKVMADLEVAKANLAMSDKKLDACSVRAPYDGRVAKLLVKENEWVEQGQPLIEIVDDQIIRAKFIVPFIFYDHIQIADSMVVHVKGINRKFACKISHISPVLEPNTATFQVFADIDNSDNFLLAGMTGEILLKLAPEK